MAWKKCLKRGGLLLILALIVYLIWQFLPEGDLPTLPNQALKIAAWMSVEWSMELKRDKELQALADDLTANQISDAYIYVSYLKAGDSLNQSYDEAKNFLARMRLLAPEIRWFAWLGVPISITQPDGTYEANRLERPEIRAMIAEFSSFTITELGFDGFHLDAELIPNEDKAFLETLVAIQAALPPDTPLSVAVPALRPFRPVTSVPYPHVAHNWTSDYLRQVGELSEQIAVMAYDSALPFPRDYRSWMRFQVEETAKALAGTGAELIIGVPTSEEWTLTHQTQSESLENALAGVKMAQADIAGIAIYPHWETSPEEWEEISELYQR
jgi:hypothetical protein